MPIDIVGVPTVREADGLATSSRNVYLSDAERRIAPVLYQTLCFVAEQVRKAGWAVSKALDVGRKTLSETQGVTLQYLEAREPETLGLVQNENLTFVVLVAAKIGHVRLIDNVVVDGTSC